MRTVKEEKKGIAIGTKSFITAIAVIFALMILTYILTLVVQTTYCKRWPSYNHSINRNDNRRHLLWQRI